MENTTHNIYCTVPRFSDIIMMIRKIRNWKRRCEYEEIKNPRHKYPLEDCDAGKCADSAVVCCNGG